MKLSLACISDTCATFILTDNGRIVKSVELSFIGKNSRQNEINRNLFSRLFVLTTRDEVEENDILWEENDAAEDVNLLIDPDYYDRDWDDEEDSSEDRDDFIEVHDPTTGHCYRCDSLEALAELKRQLEERA